jgi:hypothetical protein
MNPKTNLSILSANDWTADSHHAPKTSLIVTSEPGLFQARFARESGKTVFLADNVDNALFLMGQLGNRLELFFADLRPSKDIWSGHRFLRHIKSSPSLHGAKVYLMSEKPLAHQVQWYITAGATGLIKPDPSVLTGLIYSHAAFEWDLHQSGQLRRIEVIFGIFAGPMRRILISEARKALALSCIEPTAQGYIVALNSMLSLPDRKAQFRKLALQAIQQHPSPHVSEAGDSWPATQ